MLLLKVVNGELVSAFVYSERGIVENFWGAGGPFPKAPPISVSQHGHFVRREAKKTKNKNNFLIPSTPTPCGTNLRSSDKTV